MNACGLAQPARTTGHRRSHECQHESHLGLQISQVLQEMFLRQLTKAFGLRDHLVKETGLAMERDIRNTHDFESLIQFCVFPEEVSLRLGKFRMVLVRINLKNLSGHARRCRF